MSDFYVGDPGEGSSSSAYPEMTSPKAKRDTIVDQDDAMSEHAEADDGSEPEDSLPWEDVMAMAILRDEVDPENLVPPKFGEDQAYPWTAAARTKMPFPEDWNEKQKAAAISPNSPYYKIPEAPRVFPSDWTPAQIAAADSPTSPYHVGPGVPITATTPKLRDSPLPGLFIQKAPAQVPQTGFGPSSPARSTSSASTDRDPQSVNPASSTQNPSHFVHRPSSVPNSSVFSFSPPSIPTPQHMNPESINYPSQSATPSSLSPGAFRSQQVQLFDNILEQRKDEEQRLDDDADRPRIWASIDQRPPPNKPVSRLAKYGNVHRQQTAEDDILRPVGGSSSANDVPCIQCGQRINGKRAELSPQERMNIENKYRLEMEPILIEKLQGVVDIQQREQIGKLTTDIRDWKDKYDKLWCEKDQFKMDYERTAREKAQQDDDFTAKEIEHKLWFMSEIDENVKKLKEAKTIDEKVHQMAKLVSIRRAGEFPSFTQKDVEQRAKQLLDAQIPMIQAGQRDQHQQEIDKLTQDFKVEMSRVRNESQAKDDAMDEVQYKTQLAERTQEFNDGLAQNRQEYINLLTAKEQELTQQFNNQLAQKTDEFNLRAAEWQQELSGYTPSAMRDEHERNLRQKDEECRRQLDEKHQEYTNLLNEKQQVIDNLRAEKEQRDNEPVFNAQPILSFEQIGADFPQDIMDIGEHAYGQGTTEVAEETKEKIRQEYRGECRKELFEEVTKEVQEKNEAVIQARVAAAVDAAVNAALKKQSDDNLALDLSLFGFPNFEQDPGMEKFGDELTADIIRNTLDPSNLADLQDPSRHVVEDSTLFDADLLDSFSNLAIADSSKPVDTQVLPKSDVAGSSAPVDTDSSKSDVIDFAQRDSLDPSKSDVAESSKPTGPSSSHPVVTDSSQPVDTQDSSKPAPDQDSSKAAVVQDSSIPAESQTQVSSVPTEAQVISDSADVTNASPAIDTLQAYKTELDAAFQLNLVELRQQYEQSRSELQEGLQKKFNKELADAKQQIDERLADERKGLKEQYDREITAAHAAHRKELEDQFVKEIESHRVKLEETIHAEKKDEFETESEHLRIQLQDEYDARLKQKVDEQRARFEKQYDDEVKKLRTKSTESAPAEQKESLERKSPRKSGKTVGQDARNSDKVDGEVVDTASKTDGSDAELLKVKKQLADLQDKHKLLQADFEAEQSSYSKLSEEHESLAKNEQSVIKSLEAAEYQITNLTTVLEATNDTVRRQRAIISNNDREITQLRNQVRDLKSELAWTVKEAREANEDVEKLRLAGQEAEANVNWLRNANEELRQKYNDLLSEISTREPEPVDDELELARQALAGARADLQRSTDQNDKLERENESQRHEIRQTRAQLGRVQNELDAANSCLVALTRDLSEARESTSGLAAEVKTLRKDKAALKEAAASREAASRGMRGSSQEGHLQIPGWLSRQLTILVAVSAFFFCAFSFLCFLGLAAEREAQQWLGGNDMPRAAMVSPVSWGIGKGGIW